jgi:hypothetical protein
MNKPSKILLMTVFGFAWILLGSDGVAAQPKNTLAEEKICKNIGFRPKTEAFGSCVLELVDRDIPTSTASTSSTAKSTSAQASSKRSPVAAKTATREVAPSVPLSPNEQTCVNYSFKRGTQAFGQCLMQLDQIQQQAMLAERQHQLQLAQYQQQVAAYEEQQKAIKKEKDRRKWEAIGRLGAGMANSTSPSFLGALNEGLAAANGYPIAKPPALPPSPPAIQNYTIRDPNGNQIYCSYNTAARYMSCR